MGDSKYPSNPQNASSMERPMWRMRVRWKMWMFRRQLRKKLKEIDQQKETEKEESIDRSITEEKEAETDG